jgi:dynein intermediate chain
LHSASRSLINPSIFATASSNGTINICNLASTLDQPVSGTEGIPIDGGAPGDPSSSSYQGLNRLQWSSDGRRLVVASGDKLHVFGIREHVWKAKGDAQFDFKGFDSAGIDMVSSEEAISSFF